MNNRLLNKKTEAKRLFLSGEFTQKQIAEKINISQKTMSIWVRTYKWRNDEMSKVYACDNPLIAFLLYLQNAHPKLHKKVITTFREFQNNK